jgi:SAM-dependent methyltransferase
MGNLRHSNRILASSAIVTEFALRNNLDIRNNHLFLRCGVAAFFHLNKPMVDPAAFKQETDSADVDWSDWLESVSGQYLLAWEQSVSDERVSDIFGFNAFQCGTPALDALRTNRMPLRRVVLSAQHADQAKLFAQDKPILTDQFEALPLESQSVDLLILPHVLEFSADPHQLLREVERVLRPEGRVIVFGLNPFSLWGARQLLTAWWFKPKLPAHTKMIPLSRLRDWLKLLEIEFDRANFGCYRPHCSTEKGLSRTGFFEALGDRFWPVCGAVYCVSAVKRVAGMRLIGPAWKGKPLRAKVGQAQGARQSTSKRF